ncbi:KaiC domain-containing protein [Halorubrum lacusprofundi]|jgi:KaiC domain protein, AF_0351 family|uniref:KaiC domain-containing protein n=1 Tax=Halorubrum lacusprofundi TaxID=2247 RepID=UPI000B5A236B|nr:KaiC domain-containing protein [Halorubrum lacusprofundi]MCG1007834.1 KaiC domain-containing protein [Halorubrum lacusprofundi]
MSDEDDWFERALRDSDADSDAAEGDEDDETGESNEDDETANGDEPPAREASDPGGGDDRADERGSDPFGGIRNGERDPSREAGDDVDEDNFAGDVFGSTESESDSPKSDLPEGDDPFGGESFGGDDPFGGGSFGEEDPFGDESANDGTPDPTGSGGGFGGGLFGDDDPFDGGSAGSGSAGGGSAGSKSTDSGSADPFGGYRGNAAGDSSGPNDVGFGEFDGGEGGGASPGFDVDPDEFESSIERTDIGIEGLDEMILGGVPRRSLLSVIGGAGTGKTTFALQFLNEALESDRKGVYITLEQTRESILSTAEEKGWSFREHAEADRLAVVAIDPIEMANSLASIRNDLTRLIAEFDADRLVLDSVSLLEMMYDHPAKRRSEVFGFTRSLKEAGVTTLLTSEANEKNPYASRHGIVEYLTDAVFVLQYIRGTDFRETRLAVEIQKIRDANHSRQSKPCEITDTGISVYGQANIF